MIRKYIIIADDSINGFDEEIAKLEREWGAEEIEPCEDCISREEALKVMCDNCPMYNCVCGCSSYRHIERMPPVTPQQTRWIPCSERLPQTDGVYIVTRRLFDNQIDTEPYYMVDACYFDGSNTWHNDNRINHGRSYLTDIIAWSMPLTEPYKESEE